MGDTEVRYKNDDSILSSTLFIAKQMHLKKGYSSSAKQLLLTAEDFL